MRETHRLWFLGGGFLSVLLAFLILLGNLQLARGAEYYETARRGGAAAEEIPAARGRLLDRNGIPLAWDETRWMYQGEEVSEEERSAIAETDSAGDLVPTAHRVSILAPHVLGRVGPMDEGEWAVYENEGYAMDALVGKDGLESVFESVLHGTPGQKVGTEYVKLPQRGRDVTLTLDKSLQAAARTALAEFLENHPAAGGGSLVALDVSNGGVLAMVSLPDYDTETFSADYKTLSTDKTHPLLNRAIQGLYAPGSVFKLVTGTAALEEGILTPETEILDTGRYTYYKHPQPQCWLYRQEGRTHGLETISEALADSCNIFFYDAGRRCGIETLGKYARLLGLGTGTGIELPGEETGVVAGPAYTESIGGEWYEGNVLSAAIGQENNRFTPLQLAHMTATLLGGGTRWQVHLEQRIEGETAYTPTALGQVEIAPDNLNALRGGMRQAASQGALGTAFRNLPVSVGAKTGSAQVAGKSESNAVLVCAAPLEDPEIALAIVVEQGGGGSGLGQTAAAVLREYFGE